MRKKELVLITGSSGFIGSALAQYLYRFGLDSYLLSYRLQRSRPHLSPTKRSAGPMVSGFGLVLR